MQDRGALAVLCFGPCNKQMCFRLFSQSCFDTLAIDEKEKGRILSTAVDGVG